MLILSCILACVEVNFARAYEHVWMLILLMHMSMCGC